MMAKNTILYINVLETVNDDNGFDISIFGIKLKSITSNQPIPSNELPKTKYAQTLAMTTANNNHTFLEIKGL